MDISKKGKVVVAYCRTAAERLDQPCRDIKQQARTILRNAKRRGVEVDHVYMDPAKSGNTLNRPALKRLLTECRAGTIGTVIVRDRERLARCSIRFRRLLAKLNDRYGVRVEDRNGEVIQIDDFETLVFKLVAARALADKGNKEI